MFPLRIHCFQLFHPLKRVGCWRSNGGTSSNQAVPSTSSVISSAKKQQYSGRMMNENEIKQDRQRFAELFRRSKFVQLADFEGRVVIGEIVRRIADDLYIDMGLKFNAVCKAPIIKNESYKIGAKVLLRLHDPELSELFLGSTKELTLLEADATLLGLYRPNLDESMKTVFLESIEKEVKRIEASISKDAAGESELRESVAITSEI
ncbi:Mitochondrial ribosomal protein MRP-S35 family protein [Acanthocheilonema viteae]